MKLNKFNWAIENFGLLQVHETKNRILVCIHRLEGRIEPVLHIDKKVIGVMSTDYEAFYDLPEETKLDICKWGTELALTPPSERL